jgi:hypothetical protein
VWLTTKGTAAAKLRTKKKPTTKANVQAIEAVLFINYLIILKLTLKVVPQPTMNRKVF